MTLITYKPRSGMINEFDRLFNNFWDFENKIEVKENINLNFRTNEDEDFYFIETDLPGVEKKDVSVNIIDDMITISGERKALKKESNNTFQCGSSNYGEFSKSFYIPEDANIDKINAKIKNGVLGIEIKKSKKIPPLTKKIVVK